MIRHYLAHYIVFFFIILIVVYLQSPFWAVIATGILFFIFIMGDTFYTVYGTTNMNKVERFIKNNKNNPIYEVLYVQSFGTKEEMIQAFDRLLEKYKKPFIQQYYSCAKEELTGNYEKGLELSERVKKEPYKTYLKALFLSRLGHLEEAEKLIPSISKEFMKEEILGIIAYKKNDKDAFEIHFQKAIESCKGVQRYSLIQTFNRIKKEGL